ncbi:hypothetical protein NPIL_350611 [Nephila pilipes]|uniref:Uncharacterized protein n=1 Tax=Nephila pilipes TaxID=299642 RepID=A0A8X6MAT5_NEPPI|nr:hypothetical protein NPIL_350611 [Nephila pilipes]
MLLLSNDELSFALIIWRDKIVIMNIFTFFMQKLRTHTPKSLRSPQVEIIMVINIKDYWPPTKGLFDKTGPIKFQPAFRTGMPKTKITNTKPSLYGKHALYLQRKLSVAGKSLD